MEKIMNQTEPTNQPTRNPEDIANLVNFRYLQDSYYKWFIIFS